MVCEQLKLDNQVCFRLYTVARLITQGYQPWLSKLGITYTQYIVLMVLWEKDHQPVNDIARRLLLETNTVTPLIKRMEIPGCMSRMLKETGLSEETFLQIVPALDEIILHMKKE